MEPPFSRILGVATESTEQLFDYGYRSAWNVRAAGQRFLMKRDDRPGFAAREAASNRHAAAHGIPAPKLIATLGEPVQFMAFRWVEGEPLGPASTTGAWRNAGAMLKRIHQLPPTDHAAHWGTVEGFEAELAWVVERGAITVGEAQAALSAVRRTVETLSGAERVFIHGDCQAAHFIIDSSGTVAAVIDWADAGMGYPEMDLAVIALSAGASSFEAVLDAYEPTPDLRGRLPATLPAFQAIRAALSYRWLETHGYPGHTWPIQAIRDLGGPAS